MSAPSDRDLIQRARRGDTEAFGELVLRYQTSVFNVCYRLLHERLEAEDMTQETFMRARDRLQTFDEQRVFGPWIRRVAANVCLNHLEAQKQMAELDEERDADESQRPETQVEVRERSEQIRRTLAALPHADCGSASRAGRGGDRRRCAVCDGIPVSLYIQCPCALFCRIMDAPSKPVDGVARYAFYIPIPRDSRNPRG